MRILCPEFLPNNSSVTMKVCVAHSWILDMYIDSSVQIFCDSLYVYTSHVTVSDAEVAALTGSLDDLSLTRRSRSPSPLLYRPTLRERYGLRPLTPIEKLDLDIRVEQALRRSRSRERLAQLELEEARNRSLARLERERARSRSRERMARLELELAEKQRERLAREELEEVNL